MCVDIDIEESRYMDVVYIPSEGVHAQWGRGESGFSVPSAPPGLSQAVVVRGGCLIEGDPLS